MSLDDSSVEKLKKSLYVRNVEPEEKPRHEFHEENEYEVSEGWGRDEVVSDAVPLSPDQTLDELHQGHIPTPEGKDTILDDQQFKAPAMTQREEHRITSRVVRAIFIASFLFFLFTVGLAGYFLIGGKNQVSCDNVQIVVSGPRSIASGKKLVLDVAVVNNNPVPMRNTSIEMQYPEGTRNAEQSSVAQPSVKEQVGTIEKGERVRTTGSAILFGKEQTDYEITSVVEYEIDDSSATFTCTQPYNVLISTSPVSLTVNGLEEISSGQELELKITVTSNSEEVVPDLRIVAQYPFGFEYISAQPEPDEGTGVWEVGDLAPGMERTVTLRGIVKGQGTEARTIVFSVGEKDPVDTKDLTTVLQKIDHPLLVTRPFMILTLKLNNTENADITADLGKEVRGVLTWKNSLPDALHDVEIELHFEGSMLNPASVGGSGFFRSVDKTVIWTPQTNEEFRTIEPGAEGSLEVKFTTNPFQKGTSANNPVMKINCDVFARRISDNIPVPQNLKEQAKKTIRFNTDLKFNAYAVYGVGPFTNTGPFPPKVDEQTTYTVVWEVTNSTNNASNVIMKAELPINIKWLGAVSPSTESLVFNPVTREVIWSLNGVARDTGYQYESRKAYFQISNIPSITQLDRPVNLAQDIVLQGTDEFTKDTRTEKLDVVNTKLEKDPYFSTLRGVVED